MGQPAKMMNFIGNKISDWMEPSQPAFPANSVDLLAHFHKIPIVVVHPVLALRIFRNFTEENNMAPITMSKSGPIICVNS